MMIVAALVNHMFRVNEGVLLLVWLCLGRQAALTLN